MAGKSTLVMRLSEDEFSDQIGATIGVEFRIASFRKGNSAIKIQFWDSMGSEPLHRRLPPIMFRGLHFVLLCFDLHAPLEPPTLRRYFSSLAEKIAPTVDVSQPPPRVLAAIQAAGVPCPGFVLVGCKSDLPALSGPADLHRLEAEMGMPVVTTSSKTGDGIMSLVDFLMKNVMQENREHFWTFSQDVDMRPIRMRHEMRRR